MSIVRKDIVMKDPARVFETPADLVESDELFKVQKIAALKQWKDELKKRLRAEDESMTGNDENAERLRQVSDALISLRHDTKDANRLDPTPDISE